MKHILEIEAYEEGREHEGKKKNLNQAPQNLSSTKMNKNILLVQVYVDQDQLLISSPLPQRNRVQDLNPAYHYTEMT